MAKKESKEDIDAKIEALRCKIVIAKVEIAVGKEKNYSKLRKLKKELAKHLNKKNKKKNGKKSK